MATVGVVGSGAVGSYYGALLARAGHDVRFLMRRDLDAVRTAGLAIRSKDGDFQLEDVPAFAHPADIGPVDWVLCALKATSLNDMPALVAPLLRPGTRIIAMMNGLGIEERFVQEFPGHPVFGGMAFVCLNRGEPGVVHHIDYGRVSIGHLGDDPNEVTRAAALLAEAGVETVPAPNLLQARWEKLCWNIPFSGLSVAAGGVGTATILGDAGLSALAHAAILEVAAAANADFVAHGVQGQIDGHDMAARMFAQTATMGDYRPSMLIDYLNSAPMEVDAILAEPCRRAAALGAPTPVVDAIRALVAFAGRRNRGEATLLTRA